MVLSSNLYSTGHAVIRLSNTNILLRLLSCFFASQCVNEIKCLT